MPSRDGDVHAFGRSAAWRTIMTSRFALIAAAATWLVSVHAASAHGPEGHDRTDHHGGAAHGATSPDGAPGKPEDVKRTVRVEATDDAFNVKQIQVKAGETVRFVITNAGYDTHEFAIASPEENEAHRAMMRQMPNMKHEDPNVVTLKPGETKEVVWRFGKDRNVEFSCNIKGHAEAGMRGTFRVGQ
jgi:uncharacterized cupredoxin-like copper-binding protein